eukprot:CAMPEP_0194250274 /NCGR_PEP_ID=MMETSP0158-20130606/22590_1 /TAXON_ID=33649 /ORGANISM="Thalassionema nitzschioides, Strain L26-B" /LENGTH=210 /DNA_ID=CAMNT_0038987013 /DNA_START=12 /DNA_END=641 /DNA_ORIENTATION=+
MNILVFVTMVLIGKTHARDPAFIVHSSFSSSSFHQHNNFRDDQDPSSVGDYVKGVHSGKYQFEDASFMSSTGKQFAESLYSSSPVDEEHDDHETIMPQWAKRMGEEGSITEEMCKEVIQLSPGHTQQITVSNQERTWESYYTKVIGNSEFFEKISCSPSMGKLAPFGGATNLCDEDHPYSDSAVLQVRYNGVTSTQGQCYLVIGTEEEKW